MNLADFTAQLRAMARGNSPRGDAARRAAEQWHEVVSGCLHRLERAADWARRGLRSEAIALAEAMPSVFQLAEAMRDPAMSEWHRFCARHDLPLPPELPSGPLETLRECFVQLEPLRDPLARWRKLNVGRAPATERLDQMRVLRGLDPFNPVWTEMAPPLEQAALAEAVEACERGLALWQLDRVQAVVEWMDAGEWLEAPASEAVAAVRRRMRELGGRSALERARAVVDRLHQEYMAEAIDHAEEPLREWQALRAFMADSGVELPEELTQRVRPVLDWIEERQIEAQRLVDHRTRLAELSAATESSTVTLEQLSRLLSEALAGPEAPAPALAAAARRRIAALRRARTIRRSLAAAGVVLAVAVLALAARAMLDRHARRLAEQRLLSAVTQRLDEHDLEGARRALLERVQADPLLAGHPSLETAGALIAKAEAEQVRRDAEFATRLTQAGDPSSEFASPALVEGLEALARTPAQRASLESWRTAQAQATIDRRQRADAAFIEQLGELERELDELGSSSDGTALAAITALRARLESLERSPGISAAAAARCGPVRVRVDALAALAEEQAAIARRQGDESRAIERIGTLLRDPAGLAAALDRFADEFPDSEHADGFRLAALDLPSWRGVIEWPAARDAARGRIRASGEDQRAEARQRLRAYIDAHPRSVHASTAQRVLDLLGNHADWRRWVAGVIEGSPLFSLRMVELRNGDRFYYEPSSAPQPASEGQRVYRVVRSLRDPAQGIFLSDYVRVDPGQVLFDGESPQRRFAQQFRTDLRAGAYDGLDGAFLFLRKWRDASDIDAILRADLLIGLLPQLSQSLPSMSQTLLGAESRLTAFEPESVSWLDPQSTDARDRSREIATALPRVIDVDAWARQWRDEVAQAERDLEQHCDPVGVLLRSAGSITLLIGSTPAPGLLEALVMDEGTARLVEIGVVDASGTPRVDANKSGSLPSGTLIVQRRTATPAVPGAPR